MISYNTKKINFIFFCRMLGCDMIYGPGESVKVWQNIFLPTDELWEGEFNKACVDESKKNGKLGGLNVLVGDQSNSDVLAGWIKDSGNNFDIIIDDGGS